MNQSRKFPGADHRSGRSWSKSFQPRLASMPLPAASQTQIQRIASSQLLSDNYSNKAKIENVEHVASFSWTQERDPTILVPGKPPRWQPSLSSQRLREDDGTYYRDQNSARFPKFPTEPAIRAIMETVPNFDPSEIDVFGCGNTIGSLLSFVRNEERSFRFGVEHIGSSLFLVRKTDKPGELIEGVYGYGHTFPEAYTQWDSSVRDSASYQRIIKYDFAGLKCFVRSESDGYLPALTGQTRGPSGDSVSSRKESPSVDQLLNLALGLQAPSGSNKLTIRRAGEMVPQRALFDLKTRALRKRQDASVESFLHRLWVNQTPNMILAYHTGGTFEPNNIHIIDVRSKISAWENGNTTMLSKLGDVLHKLIDIAKRDDRHCFEVRRIDNGPLQIWSEIPGWSALPLDLKQHWGIETLDKHAAASDQMIKRRAQDSEDEDEEYLKF